MDGKLQRIVTRVPVDMTGGFGAAVNVLLPFDLDIPMHTAGEGVLSSFDTPAIEQNPTQIVVTLFSNFWEVFEIDAFLLLVLFLQYIRSIRKLSLCCTQKMRSIIILFFAENNGHKTTLNLS